ncbi:hypothetical protein [Vibrio parahaemolyticus]|uniref:hypothetical protein n=3 Tax=Vibrio parahaemolyticus TaxID=670 RepID=UPI00040FF92F|nr:hypothetical protein [Vibrio parahaemolyticus]MBE4489884.1 hypothetical protein [Vibrio parahaemolyticus]MBE4493802.1 hypothetical protein [Vibrio parahaemolyticus]MBE4502928.1 hypothetical protein [Vibrio parahaemolyticus]MBE4505231.1 hypothetical protein [Vibrio parahaemolyticus]HCH3717198.1 hypothetical protein [Vibrio parahaemolyticus]
MKLEFRMRQSINRRTGVVLSRSDLAQLGSKTQVTHVLNTLVKNGEILRLSGGFYAKAQKDTGDKVKAQGSLDVIIREVADKLGITLYRKGISFSNESALKDEIVVEIENPRVNRKLFINGKTILFRGRRNKHLINKNISLLPQNLPTKGVASYVLELARFHKIAYSYNAMDQWANAVTRLAGDEVKHDDIEDLLIALKRAGKISKKDVAMLAVNYLREKKQSVRSI